MKTLLVSIILSFIIFNPYFAINAQDKNISIQEIQQCIQYELEYLGNIPLNQQDMIASHGGVFVFDPNRLKWMAYDAQGNIIARGKASGGKDYCPDVKRACRTPSGKFKVYHRRGANCVSSKFPLNRSLPRAKMPYCTFFYRGYAIHGSYDVPNYNASHGCIRVQPEDARWLYNNFLHTGTTVIVKPYQ